MFKMPIAEIKQKLVDKSSLSSEDVEKKIKEKLSQLSGLISEEGAAHIVANELGVKLIDKENLKIKNLGSGMRNIDILGKALQVYEVREFQKDDRQGKVGNFLMGDETGTLRVVLWNDQANHLTKIKPGDIVKIQSAYVRENQGRTEIHLNDYSKLKLNPEGETVNIAVNNTQTPEFENKKIEELQENNQNAEVLATIVQVYDPRFYEVCPECGKRTKQGPEGYNCPEHGKITPKYSYLLNAYIDDGTSNIRTVFFREQALQVLGIKEQEMQKFRENPSSFETKKNELLGNIIKVSGRVSINQTFGSKDFIATTVLLNPDPEKEIKNLEKQPTEKTGQKQENDSETKQEQKTEQKESVEKAKEPEAQKKTQEDDDLEEELYSLEELEEAIE